MLFQILFLAVYDLFLRKETFFQINRFYLIATPVISFLLPFVKIPTFQKTIVGNETIIFLPEIILSPQSAIEKTSWYASINYFEAIFLVGIITFFIIFMVKLIKIIKLINANKAEKRDFFKLIFLPNKTKAFSFFNYIFLGKEIPKAQQEKIIEHEAVHSKQKHSADLLFFESLKIVMWFNPLLYFYQHRISVIHEYIADDFATKNSPKETYINTLLSEVFAVENISFINQFYKKSFLKKRIIMMTKEKSKQVKQLKYLVLIPVLACMLFYTSCAENELNEQTEVKKEFSTMYMKIGNGDMTKKKTEKETYLDFYMGTETPNWKEIEYSDLKDVEKIEYDNQIMKYKEIDKSFDDIVTQKLYKGDNGRIVLANIIDFSKVKTKVETQKVDSDDTTVPFSIIETPPTFPGCDAGDKNCFSQKIQKHFAKNFDKDLPKNLGLKSGRKKIYIGFKIDKEGNVADIKARAPHRDIESEVIRVMESLPKMIPGKQRGTNVDVKYSIPFTIVVE